MLTDENKPKGITVFGAKFALGDRVTKVSRASWTGHVVGFYTTHLTPIGYCIESVNEPGSVQIYPEAALRADPLPKVSRND